jgi:hypothetical protein
MSRAGTTIVVLVTGMALAGSVLAQTAKGAAVTATAPAASGSKPATLFEAGTKPGATVTDKLAACNAKAKAQKLKRKAKRTFMQECAKAA